MVIIIKVQEVNLGGNKTRYLLLDDDYNVIKPVKRYLKYLDNLGRSPNTIKNYTHHLKLYFDYLSIINMKYNEINSNKEKNAIDVLSDFIGWLKIPHYLNDEVNNFGKIDPLREHQTINIIISVVLSFYDFLARNNEFDKLDVYKKQRKNPHFKNFLYELVDKHKELKTNIFKLKTIEPEIKFITRKEFKSLKENCNLIRDKLLISIMFEGGLRLGEVLGLQLTDIEIWNNKIKIIPRENLENGVRVKNNAKGSSFFPPYVMKLFADYLTEEYGDIDSNFVFVNLYGKNIGSALKPGTVEKLFERLSLKIDKKVTPHMCRHGHATELVEEGFKAIDIKDDLRHAHIQSTFRYTHYTDKFKIKKVKELQNKLNGGEKN